MRGLAGVAALLALAWLLSENRRRIPWRTVGAGLALQLALALLLVRLAPARAALVLLNDAAEALQAASDAGTALVFGYLGGAPLPFAESQPGAAYVLAFRALPLVLLISALASLLFHWGVLQRVTAALAWALRRIMGIGGALGLGAVVHIFVGMVEAPLLVRPYLAAMQRGELLALMSCGLAGVAGTVMVIYASLLAHVVPEALGTILASSFISTPAAIALSAMLVPFRPDPGAEARITLADPPAGAVDAVVKGTMDGIPVLAGIVALLVVAVALVHLVNAALGLVAGGLTLQAIAAVGFRPVMWLIGVPWAETGAAAALMATKTVLNEFVAYLDLSRAAPDALSPRTRLIMVYALCGFANFGSLGILVGGLGTMVPDRRREVTQLGLRSMLAGTMATCMSGAWAGVLTG